jgi:hypothetical protein
MVIWKGGRGMEKRLFLLGYTAPYCRQNRTIFHLKVAGRFASHDGLSAALPLSLPPIRSSGFVRAGKNDQGVFSTQERDKRRDQGFDELRKRVRSPLLAMAQQSSFTRFLAK